MNRTAQLNVASWWTLAVVAVVAGAWLRGRQLNLQILIDDEWHAIHRLFAVDIGQILTRLGYADYSIPMTVYFRWLYEHGWLSEQAMHAPSLAAGVAFLLVGPWLLRRWISLPVLATWLALVAVSPLLVYHSKVARPYALTVLLTFVAIVSFRRYWLEGDRRTAALYVATAWLSGYLHLITLPFVLMPLAYYGWPALRKALIADRTARDRGPLLRLLAVGGVLAALLLIAVLPPVVNDWQQFTAKAGRDHVTPETVTGSVLLLWGTGYTVMALALTALTVYGWLGLRERAPDLARYVLIVNAVAAVAVAASGAIWISHSLVYARYLMPALPFLLWLAAEGIIRIIERFAATPLSALAVLAFASGLCAFGPIPAIDYFPNQFWGHLRFQFDYDPGRRRFHELVPPQPVPAFYRRLAALPPGSVTLVETPWYLESYLNPYSEYQEVHRQFVKMGLLTPMCGARKFGEYPESRTGIRMRHLVHVGALLRGDSAGADYLVVHKRPWPVRSRDELEWPDIEGCLPAIRAALGAPVYGDEDLLVFALSETARRLGGLG